MMDQHPVHPERHGALLIADLITESGGRVEKMLRTETRPTKPSPKNAYLDSLRDMNGPKPPPPAA